MIRPDWMWAYKNIKSAKNNSFRMSDMKKIVKQQTYFVLACTTTVNSPLVFDLSQTYFDINVCMQIRNFNINKNTSNFATDRLSKSKLMNFSLVTWMSFHCSRNILDAPSMSLRIERCWACCIPPLEVQILTWMGARCTWQCLRFHRTDMWRCCFRYFFSNIKYLFDIDSRKNLINCEVSSELPE